MVGPQKICYDEDMSKLWLVKDRRGRIQGPYTEEEIRDHIKEDHFTSGALIALYPSGKWKAISSHPTFYKAILKSLDGEAPVTDAKSQSAIEEESAVAEEPALEPAVEPTVIIPREKRKKKKKKINIPSPHPVTAHEEDEENGDFEEDEETGFFRKTIRRPIFPILGIAFVLLIWIIFVPGEKGNQSSGLQQVRLLSPQKQKQLLSSAAAKKEFKQAVSHYKKDTVLSYLKAQRQIVYLLERTKNHYIGYSHLCLIHLELWPFAYQDSKDRKARNDVQDRISRMDKGGVSAGLCSAVSAFLSGNYEKSLMIVESSLNAMDQTSQESPVFFYYVKAKALKALQRMPTAQNYLQSIHGFLPNWIAPYMLSARIFYEAENFPAGAKIYQQVLSFFPGHPTARLYLGVIEYNYFGKMQKSEKRLKSVVSNLKDLVNPEILTEAYVALTKISLAQKDNEKALKYAEQAYALDPSNSAMADVMFKLSGTTKIEKGKVKTRQLIYRGDILVDQGRCTEAQEYYKQAYLADNKRNALAAVRMARCFWKQGVSGEAIQWLKRATVADPKMMEAYFLLADYYSVRYFFNEAADVLKAARRKNPDSYEVFKGYALLAFRQENYTTAISYAEKSLTFYTSDVDVYVLLSKSHRALREFSKAYDYAVKATEEDVNSVPGQISYALALGSAYGFARGEEHFQTLIQNFPVMMEYRQALGEYYFEERKYDLAKDVFENIVAQSPEFKPAHIHLGRIYSHFAVQTEDEKVMDRAVTYFLKASLADPADPEPLFYMGRLYIDMKKLSAAEDQFEKIIRMNANYPMIYYFIGLVNFLQGGEENLKRALEAGRIEVQKNPNLSSAYILLGNVYTKQAEKESDPHKKRAQFELCKQEYQKAVQLRPKDVSLYVSLINCYVGSGETDAALQVIKQFVAGEGTSGYAELYKLKGKIYEMKGNYQSAGSAYEQYFGLHPVAPDRGQIEGRLKPYYEFKKNP